MDETVSESNRLLVAAFDFGTTYSGYAFSFKNEPLKVKTNQNWIAGSEKLISLKTPTCVLLDQNKKFHSFGFEAENKFTSLAEDKDHHGWYFFRRFKMELHNKGSMTRTFEIEDINGRPIRAMTLFMLSIRYLKDHLLEALDKQTTGIELHDINFVITVPAIWEDNAKLFMREAAIEAGIPSVQLRIALEPEAASVWCQIISSGREMSALGTAGSVYMVVDLGGGTADITVHEKMKDGTLKERDKASGGGWGGNEVDKAYIKMLTEIVGESTMEQFKREEIGDFFDILREFETKKRTVTTGSEGKLTFRIPALLKEMYEENENKKIKTRITETSLGQKLTWSGDKIRLEVDVAKAWFSKPIHSLVTHIRGLLRKPALKDVGQILLVGGFSECQLVQDAFKIEFTNVRLVVPEDAGLVVLKGAVRYGHIPNVVSERISRFSYGKEEWKTFDSSKHPYEKLYEKNNVQKCKDLYFEIVKIGESLPLNKEFSRQNNPAFAESTSATINVFRSTIDSCTFVTDEGVTKLGSLRVQLPPGNTKEEKKHMVTFKFGGTELFVKVKILQTGEEYETQIDCL